MLDVVTALLPAAAIILTGLYALFRAGGFVNILTFRLQMIEKQFSKLLLEFAAFQKRELEIHFNLEKRLGLIETALEKEKTA